MLLNEGDTFATDLFSAHCGIYAIVNTESGRAYVGQSIDILGRWRAHYRALIRGKHTTDALQYDWIRYDEDAFEFRVLELCDPDVLTEREDYWIDSWSPKPYNHMKAPKEIMIHDSEPEFESDPSPSPESVSESELATKPDNIKYGGFVRFRPLTHPMYGGTTFRCDLGNGLREYTPEELEKAIGRYAQEQGKPYCTVERMIVIIEGIMPFVDYITSESATGDLMEDSLSQYVPVDCFHQFAHACGISLNGSAIQKLVRDQDGA